MPGDAGAAAAMDDGDGGSLSPPPTPGKKRLHDDPFSTHWYMGSCQNYGPFLGPYYNTAPII